MSRPEHQAPPEIYYDIVEAKKYTCNSRIIEIQREMAERALELLALPNITLKSALGDDTGSETGGDTTESGSDSDTTVVESDASVMDFELGSDDEDLESSPTTRHPYFILDIGVGSGLCANVLETHGISWIGMDISEPMLRVAQSRQTEDAPGESLPDTEDRDSSDMEESSDTENTCEYESKNPNLSFNMGGDLLLCDMGEGVPLRPGLLDGVISISALQWLCNADKSSHEPRSRLSRLFTTLYASLRHGARAVFQYYPQDKFQIDMILNTALKVGFQGGLVIDYPNSTKRKKYFLVLMAGQAISLPAPKLDHDASTTKRTIQVNDREQMKERRFKKRKGHGITKDKEWVLKKKDLYRKRGYRDIPEDSKFTARKRRPKF